MAIDLAKMRAARAMLGWTQADLAEAAGVATITIRIIEKGHKPSRKTVDAIEMAFERAGVRMTETGVERK
jgi:DNA-binding XRE family transcriptional regulator